MRLLIIKLILATCKSRACVKNSNIENTYKNNNYLMIGDDSSISGQSLSLDESHSAVSLAADVRRNIFRSDFIY